MHNTDVFVSMNHTLSLLFPDEDIKEESVDVVLMVVIILLVILFIVTVSCIVCQLKKRKALTQVTEVPNHPDVRHDRLAQAEPNHELQSEGWVQTKIVLTNHSTVYTSQDNPFYLILPYIHRRVYSTAYSLLSAFRVSVKKLHRRLGRELNPSPPTAY